MITSGVGAGNVVSASELILRLFTTNPLIPTNSIIEFTAADDVGTYFGFTSVEYKRAAFYFSFVSKNITVPSKISFARWAGVAVPSTIFGVKNLSALSTFNAIATGDFTLTMGGFTNHFTGINLSAAASLAQVASIIQAAIQSFVAGGAAFTAATVTYDAVRGSFNLQSGAAIVDIISSIAGTVQDVRAPLGWYGGATGAIYSNGSLAQTLTSILTTSTSMTNNFGSFAFVPSLTAAQITEVATWNNLQNVDYIYKVPVSSSTAATVSAALIGLSGSCLTLSPLSTEYPELLPSAVQAATNYNRVNSTQNYMFQTANLTPSVTLNADADTYDALRVNYYGVTQNAGQLKAFYQRGIMMGGATAPVMLNTYANEQWLKRAMLSELMTLLLSLGKLSANAQGRGYVLNTLQSVVELAKSNGTISVQGLITNAQKIYITGLTNDPNAWIRVQNDGVWLDAQIESYAGLGGIIEYKITYILIYKKDDVVNKIEGSHVLI
jgi:Protein of unknown function (DUF3383)